MAEIVSPGYKDPSWNEIVPCYGQAVTKRPDVGCGALIRITRNDLYTVEGAHTHGSLPLSLTAEDLYKVRDMRVPESTSVYVVYRCPCGSATVHPQSRSLMFLNLPSKKVWEERQRAARAASKEE